MSFDSLCAFDSPHCSTGSLNPGEVAAFSGVESHLECGYIPFVIGCEADWPSRFQQSECAIGISNHFHVASERLEVHLAIDQIDFLTAFVLADELFDFVFGEST